MRTDITRMNVLLNITYFQSRVCIFNQYKNSIGQIKSILKLNHIIEENHMNNLGLEIVFWLILLSYLRARFTQTKKGFKQEY